MKKPSVRLRCPANQYSAGSDERIIEFFDGETQLGGLVSFRRIGSKLRVEVYRCDPGVELQYPMKDWDMQPEVVGKEG